MHAAEQKTARVSVKQMAAARKAASEKLSSSEFLMRCAQLQELNHWEYTKYNFASGLLKHVNSALNKISGYEIKTAVERTFGKECIYKQMRKVELSAHGEYHRFCTEVSWYRHVIFTAEHVQRYGRLSLLDCSTSRRLGTLKKLQEHISKFCADEGKISYDRIISPLEQWKNNIETKLKSLPKNAMAYKSLSTQLQAITKAMGPSTLWLDNVRSGPSWRSFIYQVIGTSTQLVKMLKWAAGDFTEGSRLSLDALVRASHEDLQLAFSNPKIRIQRSLSDFLSSANENGDERLKSLDGDYKLEACTPFHLNFKCVCGYLCVGCVHVS